MIYFTRIGGALISRQSTFTVVLLIILSIVTLGVLIFASNKMATQDMGGGHFRIEWIASRAKVVDGISPYSVTARNRIQDDVGKLFNWAESPDPSYTSPLYSLIIALPFILIQDASVAHTAWLVAQFVVILLTIMAGIRLIGWRPAWWYLLIIMFLIFFSPRITISWYEGSPVIWLIGVIMAIFFSLRDKRYELSGFLLALSMIQPQVVLPWVVFVLIWAGSKRLWRLVFWFFSSLAILCVLAAFLVPDWLIQYARILWNFTDYYPPGTPGYAFQRWWPGLGRELGWALTAILGVILLGEWWLARRREFRWFLWTSCLTLTVTMWIGIPITPDAHVLLTLPMLIICALFDERWKLSGKWVVLIAVGLVVLWEWYLIYSAISDIGSLKRLMLMFPMPMLLLVALYWVRWWALRPKRLLIDELLASQTY